jgi:chorismate synthase
MSLRFLTAGDSHGETLVGIVEGLPAGVRLSVRDIQKDLYRRRRSHGRSSRQIVEDDDVTITGGLWKGRTTGAPVALLIPNRGRTVRGRRGGALGTKPRPGHADLAGCLKYGLNEIPPVSERASARSTAMRVAIGAVARAVLKPFAIDIAGHVLAIGSVTAPPRPGDSPAAIRRRAARSPVYCADGKSSRTMVGEITSARAAGNSLGGSVEVLAGGVPAGLGSHAEWDRRLEARLAAAMMSIPSVKAVEIGDGLAGARKAGVDAHDAIHLAGGRIERETNFAGGIEGGMTNGETVVVRAWAKPIPTARRRARTFDMKTGRATESPYVRSDVCVIPAVSVIAEAVMAWEIAREMIDKFGGDHIDDTSSAAAAYRDSIAQRLRK